MSILSGNAIAHEIADGRILIDPYRPEHLNPASIDLTLGDQVRTYEIEGGIDRVLDPK